MYNAKNYTEQGGSRTVIGGEIDITGDLKRSGTDISAKLDALGTKFVSYQVEDLAAGADIADRSIFFVPTGYKLTLTDVSIIPQGSSAGIDNSNTCVVAVKNGSNAIVSKTYNATATFPADATPTSLGSLSATYKVLAAGEVVKFSVTNGATADTPLFMIQLTGILEKV